MKHILITGGLGFIGSTLAKKLCAEEGNKVTILTRSEAKKKNMQGFEGKITIILKDICDITPTDIEGQEEIYHFASTVDNYTSLEQPYLDLDVNCRGTIALLEAMRKGKSSARLFFASTFFVNGNVTKLPVTPETPCRPLGAYAITRLAAEQFCQVYHTLHGINATIGRFTNVFGPFEQGDNLKKAAFNGMIHKAVHGEEIKVYNNGEFYRDFVYVDDAVAGAQKIMEKGERGKVYYIGRGERVPFKDLVCYIEKHLPNTKKVSITPPDFHKKVGVGDFIADVTPLKGLGWEPQVSLEEGIKRTIAFYQGAC
ncbi:NAD-dependent epimerase/dehydratase family protein [Candidatus Pacearchaeota archaeon]|nr:NAD-dependent epimerase/dehydratase family protein [Candidatus Pacearchaeota archaeon]